MLDQCSAEPPVPAHKRAAGGKPNAAVAVETLRAALRGLAEVRGPGEAQEPILTPAARTAVFEWLSEINAADDLAAVGLRPRSTALLEGPPGTGKTTLAHHLAARLGIPLALVGPENLQGMYLSESERNTARLFDTLRDTETPCVVFLDEFDSLGARRKGAPTSGASEGRLAALTVLLRRIEEHRGLLVAATNRADDIDPALWRRFHIQLSVGLPGEDERYAILARYADPFDLGEDGLEMLTQATAGASPALLRGLAEGMKRALVLAPKLRADVSRADRVFARIIASLRPPPEIEGIPLWVSPDVVGGLAGMPWPPARRADG